MLKKILVLLTSFFCLFNVYAQEEYNFKLTIETGILPLSEDSENLGLFLNVEPKLKILENTFMGLRIGLTLNSHTFEDKDPAQYNIDNTFDNGVLSFVPTVDYYLSANNYHPYLGLGLGVYLLPNPIEAFRTTAIRSSENVIEGNVNKRLGMLLRGGFELRKLRIGLEYNFVPKADIEIPNGEIIGTVGNSYFGLSIGLVIRAGKSAN